MEEIPQGYLTQLREILAQRFSLEDLRTLCFDLGVDAETLPGEGKEAKARELVAYLDNRKRIPDLVRLGRARRSEIEWEFTSVSPSPARPEPPRKKYYVTSGMSESEIAGKFNVADASFERTTDLGEADFIIFDLSKPPVDWLKYVGGTQPLLPYVIFVALEGMTALDGKSILDIVNSCYDIQATVWRDSKDLPVALKTAEFFIQMVGQIGKESRRMVIAARRASA